MENILDNLTDAQESTLKEFRQTLKEIIAPEHTDHYLLKFLRAKNFNLREAVRIFNQNYYTRIIFGLDTIVDTYQKSEIVKKYAVVSVFGFAKDGSLIQYIAAGRLDACGFLMSMSCSELCLYTCYVLESELKMLKEQNLKTGRNVEEITFVWDLAGCSIQQIFHKCVIEMGLDFARIMQDCYPEVWGMILVVNVPTFFNKVFNLFKPAFRSAISEKIKVADKSSSKNLLLRYIDEDVLPAFLGGRRLDSSGDPECKEFVEQGGKIPERLYSRNTAVPLSPSDPDVKSLTIGPRSVHNIIVSVQEPRTNVRMQISSEDGSISVAAFHKMFGGSELPAEDEYLDDTAEDMTYRPITVEIKLQLHCAQEDFTILLPWPGIYVVRLSNYGSWFSSRRLKLKYEIFPPEKTTAS